MDLVGHRAGDTECGVDIGAQIRVQNRVDGLVDYVGFRRPTTIDGGASDTRERCYCVDRRAGISLVCQQLSGGIQHGCVDRRVPLRAEPMLGLGFLLRIEIIEGLHRLRVVLEPSPEAPDLSFDLEFESDVPANLEARHFHRQLERVTFDTQRFVQSGTWAGTLTLDGEAIPVTPDTWRGNRDRSWGVRPVGEAEPPGRKADPAIAAEQNFFWIYSIMQFGDFTIVTVIQEDRHGRRIVEDSTRVFADRTREREWLGRPDHELTFVPGTREVKTGTLYFRRPGSPGKPDHVLTVTCEPVLPHYLGVGTGYGLEQDWRHGMWQGELVVQGFREKVSEIEPWKKMFSPVDNLARFTIIEDGVSRTGAGLFEVAVIGPHAQYGFTGVGDVAP